jgi:hypothetical protein
MAYTPYTPDNLDAFARLRVANPQTIFDSKQIEDNQPLFWDDQQTSGSGTTSTYNANQASTTISVGNLTAGTRVRQTFRHLNYQPAKSQLVIMTAIMGNAQTNITKRIGQFNEKNGLFFELIGTGIGVVVRSFTSGSVVDTRVAQSSWNLDKLDGTGPSGYTLDTSKTLIYFFDYEWLGVGSIRFGFFIDGKPIYCHRVDNSNINTVVYMSTPNLPLRYEIINSGLGAASSLTHICTSVVTEGGRSETGIIRGLNRATDTLITLNTTDIFPLVGLRLKTTNLGAFIRFIDQKIICTSTAEYAWYLILSPTVVGVAPTWIALANSSVEYCFPSNTTTLSAGTILATGLASDSASPTGTQLGTEKTIQSDLVIGSNIAGTPQEVFLGVQRLTGTTETFYASINFSETV